MKNLLFFSIWTLCVFIIGFFCGRNASQRAELKKEVVTYQKREKNTIQQEKTAEKIKIIYRDLRSDKKDCDFVLNFDLSRCLPK